MNSHHNYSCTHRTTNSGSLTSPMPVMPVVPVSYVYPRGSPCDQLKEQIHQTHLSYLNQDDTPEKLDQKTKLEGLIVEYLSVVPHSKKFSHAEIGECLDESVKNPNFSAYKAAMAFEIIEKFAVNLLTRPWRKEYHVIYPYGGFFKHMVNKQLYGSEFVLYLMGYEPPTSSYSVISLNDSPLDPDRLASVALDCLIAFVECQILIQIRDALKRKSVFVNWLEIYTVRTKYICGMDDVVKLECEMKRNDLMDCKSCMPSLSSKYSSSALYERRHHPHNSWNANDCSQYVKRGSHPSKSNAYNHDELVANESFDLMHFPVPVEQPLHVTIPSCYGNVASVPFITPPPPMFASSSAEPSSMASKQKPEKVSRSTQVGIDGLSSTLSHLTMDESHASDLGHKDYLTGTARDLLACSTKADQTAKPVGKSCFYDTVDGAFVDSKKTSERMGGRKSSLDKRQNPLLACPKSDSIKANKTGKMSLAVGGSQKVSTELSAVSREISPVKWSCSSCTFLNANDREICEMCSRSREKGPEVLPLVSGGKECPRCTLVNDKNIKFCTACETDLLDSPTYI